MKHIDIIEILKGQYTDQKVTVCGWVRTSRDSKNMAFLELNDGTTLKHLQIVIDKAVMSDIAEFMKLGTSLKVEGTVVKSVVAEDSVEVNAESITVLGVCPPEYPYRKNVIRLNTCVPSPRFAYAPTHLTRYFECVR